MSAGPRLHSVFNTHCETIRARREDVWELFFDRAQWMESFESRRDIMGDGRTVGSRAEVRMRVEGSPVRWEEVLHDDPEFRLVVRVTTPEGQVLAHGDFQFADCAAGCELKVSIHSCLIEASQGFLDSLRAKTDAKIAQDFAQMRIVAERLASAS